MRSARKHIGWYTDGLPDSESFRDDLNRLTDADAQLAAVRLYFARLADSHDALPLPPYPAADNNTLHSETRNERTTTMKRPKLNGHAAIAEVVGNSLNEYHGKLDGEPADNLYELVIGSVEKTLISDVLTRTKGNQSEAAGMLGINRNTLRAKLDKHKIKPYQA